MSTTRKLRLADPHAELPIKNHKYVKNCTELYMASKRIDKIANFDAFVNLEVLWINDNQRRLNRYQIQELDGLDGCFRIKQLYAQNNSIRYSKYLVRSFFRSFTYDTLCSSLAGSSLPRFKFLQELRLYDNQLKDLQGTLEVLSRLSRLRDLDLFGNAVVEEENYRLQVIRAIPSLDVLDRHVITDEERAQAASTISTLEFGVRRLQLHSGEDGGVHGSSNQRSKKSTKQAVTVASTPPQALSGTVKMLFKEVAAIKREQQKQAHESAEREQQELTRTQLQALSAPSKSRWNANTNKANEISGVGDWEVMALKKFFQSLEHVKNSGIAQECLESVVRYLRTRGYAVSYNGFRLEGKTSDLNNLKNIIPESGNIQWKPFVQSKQLQCEMLSPLELRQQAAACFDKCAVMQQLVKDSLELSQQGYHLQALADDDHSSSRSKSSHVPSSADDVENWESKMPTSTPRTSFYMTAFTREKIPVSQDCSSKFSALKRESEAVSDSLVGKYKLRHKVRNLAVQDCLISNRLMSTLQDFTKYLAKKTPATTKLVRRNYQL
ncbi:Leucine-rich repeat-containing protein 72 [Phytophthora citrophthora]|uniref:Leucine-rich repeat-containing protein 72 n=1 Tax=Phytophthora citrophthora TaxID=4793 RepID=A0AAD9GWP8_9STRA|nr:Leucine-rich repeat-containing protein 72 [Phytophthora citrophthora]